MSIYLSLIGSGQRDKSKTESPDSPHPSGDAKGQTGIRAFFASVQVYAVWHISAGEALFKRLEAEAVRSGLPVGPGLQKDQYLQYLVRADRKAAL